MDVIVYIFVVLWRERIGLRAPPPAEEARRATSFFISETLSYVLSVSRKEYFGDSYLGGKKIPRYAVECMARYFI